MPPALRKDVNETRKRDRKSLTYDFKHDVLKRLESGVHRSVVGRELSLADSTLRHIIKNAHKIKNHFSESTSTTPPPRYYARVSLYGEMDKRLFSWIENMKLKNASPITPRMICEEAKRLFTVLKHTHKGPKNFYATSGWYSNFERRAKERNIDITGRVHASAEQVADFPNKLKQKIESEVYPPKLVFNVSTTTFYWKRFPLCISSIGHSDSTLRKMSTEERVTVLLGGNVEGDCLLTPLIVHSAETSPALGAYSEQHLPFIWRSNNNLKVTKEIFDDWYTNYFCTFVKDYCVSNQLEPKALLLLDRAQGLPTDPCSVLPVDITVIPEGIQSPMEKGAVATFKARYYERVIDQILNDVNVQCQQGLCQWMEAFDILRSATVMGEVWKQMKPDVMNGVWADILPQTTTWAGSVLAEKDAAVMAIVDKIASAGLTNISREEVEQLISSYDHTVEEEDGADVAIPAHEGVSDDDFDNESVQSHEFPAAGHLEEGKLTTAVLETALNHIDTAFELLEQHDSDWERISSVRRIINDGVSCYKEMLISRREKPKQNTIYGFLKSATRKSALPEDEVVE